MERNQLVEAFAELEEASLKRLGLAFIPQFSSEQEVDCRGQVTPRLNTARDPEFESGRGSAKAFSLLTAERKVRRAERRKVENGLTVS